MVMKNIKIFISFFVFAFIGACGEEPGFDTAQAYDENEYNISRNEDEISVSKIMDLDEKFDNNYQQSLAVYGNQAFAFSTKGACRVINLATHEIVAETRLASYASNNHANSAEFSNIFLDHNDYPLLYVTPLYNLKCHVENYDATNNKFSLVQTIAVSTTIFNDNKTLQFSLDKDKSLLYAISFSSDHTKCYLRWFRIPSIDKKSVVLTDDDLLGAKEFQLLNANYGQASYIINNKLYLMFGTNKTQHEIYVVDLDTFQYKYFNFTFQLGAEPEGLAPYQGYLIVNTNFPGGIYRLMKLQKQNI